DAASGGPGREILAAEAADLAAEHELGAARNIVADAGGRAGCKALDERVRQRKPGVVGREKGVGGEADITRKLCPRRPGERISHLGAGAGAAGGKVVVSLLGAEAVGVGAVPLPDGKDGGRRLDLEPLHPVHPGEPARGDPAVAWERRRRRPGQTVVADAGAPDRGVEAHARQDAPAALASDGPAIAPEPAG